MTDKPTNLQRLNTLRNTLIKEVKGFRDMPTFDYKWPCYQRALGMLEGTELCIAAIDWD
tara:strand:+ start:11210 stop:11386 length:177 start_codon:yes stop_codon:yes gene_type:complete